MSLSHCFVPLHFAPIPINVMLGDVLRWLDRIIHSCGVVKAPDVSNVISFTHRVPNATYCAFSPPVSKLFSSSLSFPCEHLAGLFSN